MKFLKITMALAATLLIAAVAMAADEGKAKGKGKGPKLSLASEVTLRIERLKTAIEGLDLSADQQEKLTKIRDEFEAKRQPINEKIGDLLTEDQKELAKQTLQSIQQSGKKGREALQSLEASVKLTDEQKQKIEPIGKELESLFDATRKQVMEVLTPEQKEKVQQAMPAGGKKGKKKAEK